MKRRGHGVAGCIYTATVPGAPNPEAANVQMNDDGSVQIQIGGVEIGQGCRTVICQIAAEALCIPFEKVRVYNSDTGVTPFDMLTASSRQTFVGGNAVLLACEQIKKVLFDSTAKKFEVPVEALDIKPGFIYIKDHPEACLPIEVAAILSYYVFRQLPIGVGQFYPFNTGQLDENMQGIPCATYSYQATIADVEVDTETGVVDVLKIYTALDCGRAINPLLLQGQMEGGAIMGLGWALREDSYPLMTRVEGVHPEFDPATRPTSFADYPIATAMDIPDIETAIVEVLQEEGPYGAKSAGEIVHNSAAPAIINAIYNAVGVRIWDLPASPDKILKGLKEKQQLEIA